MTNITCSKCYNEHFSFEGFTILSLSLSMKSKTNMNLNEILTINDCFSEYIKKEEFKEENKFLCSSCKRKQNCVKSHILYLLPRILILHLKRFKTFIKGKMDFVKDRTKILINEFIDIKQFVSKDEIG